MPHAEPNRSYDTYGRDSAIDRVRRTTHWVVALAVAGTGVLIGIAAHDAPGHSARAAATSPSVAQSGSGTAPASSGSGSSGSSFNGSGISAPSVGPSSTGQSPLAVTGQS
ncbi:MAG TPA: hypothetical protein VK277_01960 [Acidimicrobiales bacterium]|nr:hypothetical protein [Acidimicrobiales bacterium]